MAEPLKIIQVIPDFGLGGVQKAGCVLAETMVRAGHDLLLVGETPDRVLIRLAPGIACYLVRGWRR